MNSDIDQNDKIVAQVESRTLYASDLDQIIHANTSKKDSLALATAYIDQWVRDQLMTREAARYFASDFEIEKLVDDYREKLLKFNLEERVVSMRFDTVIERGELISFYEEMKEQFPLSEPIFRCVYAKYPRDTENLSEYRKHLNDENYDQILDFIRLNAVQSQIDTMIWFREGEFYEWNQDWSPNRMNKGQIQRQNDQDYEYFLKIVDRRDIGTFSPFNYIRPQLTRMLLHKRKQEILEKYKQDLYESALNNNLIKIPQ